MLWLNAEDLVYAVVNRVKYEIQKIEYQFCVRLGITNDVVSVSHWRSLDMLPLSIDGFKNGWKFIYHAV